MTQSNFGSPTQFEITEIKIDNQDSKESYRYRYNLSGEPLKDNFMTDAAAVLFSWNLNCEYVDYPVQYSCVT